MSTKMKNMMKYLPYIVAVDFDGTLVSDSYPEIGSVNETLVKEIKKAQLYHPKIKWVLWTCRTGKALEEAIQWCKDNKLNFDAYNKNIDEVIELFGEDTRKVYANLYVDDKNVHLNELHEKFGLFHV